jgi:ABC-type sugar transport system substrate-binding protein
MTRRDRSEGEVLEVAGRFDHGVDRRRLLKGAAALGLGAAIGTRAQAHAQEATPTPIDTGTPEPPSGKKIGVSVAYLSVQFYANFKTGLADGAKRFGFEYELQDGGSGDITKEVAVIQNFITKKFDLILLTPSGEGIIPGIKLANDAGIPVIEVNNRAGFGSDKVDVVTYVGADDENYGKVQAQILDQTFAGNPAKIGYVQGIAGTSPQILREKGFKEEIADKPQYQIVATVNDAFAPDKALAVTQDLLTRFPKGQLDVIVMQGPEGVAAADFARKNGREEVKFILGDYPSSVRQAIIDGYVVGTVDQDPYPQAFEGMHMAWLLLNGRENEIPKPFFQPLPIITKENAEQVPAAYEG